MSKCDINNKFLFYVLSNNPEEIPIYLAKNCTVGQLKSVVSDKLSVSPSKLIIDCWHKNPQSDDDILSACFDSEVIYLVVYNSDHSNDQIMDLEEDNRMDTSGDSNDHLKELEECAAIDFIEYFSNNFDDRGIMFHVCRLDDALEQACFTSLNSRKILLLYFHNKNDKFAKQFAENLVREEVKEIINRRFFLLGWDVEKEPYHKALIEALNSRTELTVLTHYIQSKICAALLIVPITDSFIILTCMQKKVSHKDFLTALINAEQFFQTENEIEQDLAQVEEHASDITSTIYQQLMLNRLGDRDYDSFEHDEFDLLEEKIGFALYGPPQSEDGYTLSKQQKKIKSLLETIIKENNKFAKWKDRVIISFIYNCIEPLPSEKKKRQKKYPDYNPNTDLNPIPLFILRKCKKSTEPCRVIIDDIGRVYRNWTSYLTKNKLHECEMILPKNGRYEADENGNVLLERHLSPACGIDTKILQGTDMASTAAGLVSGGIFVAAAIPTIAVAPAALVVAGATGIGVGLYSIGRSAYALYDRSKHNETLSFANSEARGAYLNLVAGSLGFVGAGANAAVTQLAAKGFNIGQGATAAVNVINMANIGASGISVVNSGYDVFDQWFNENQTPSMLTIVQLTSSILFFGHAVYSFKSAGTLIEESQTKALRDYQDSLRSNRHRKTFNKMLKETIRQNDGNVQRGRSEVIKTVLNIQNKDEVFATLTRMNKKMNESNVKFFSENGEIKLNGVSIDISKFGSMDRAEAAAFLSTLPSNPEPTPAQVNEISIHFRKFFTWENASDIGNLAMRLAKIFTNADATIKDKMIEATTCVIMKLKTHFPGYFQELSMMFPGVDKYLRLGMMVNGYFQKLIDKAEEMYQKWKATKNPDFQEPYFVELALDYSKRVLQLFEIVTRVYFCGDSLTEYGLKKLIEYFVTWFAKQAVEFQEEEDRKKKREIHSGSAGREITCPDCGGVYYRF